MENPNKLLETSIAIVAGTALVLGYQESARTTLPTNAEETAKVREAYVEKYVGQTAAGCLAANYDILNGDGSQLEVIKTDYFLRADTFAAYVTPEISPQPVEQPPTDLLFKVNISNGDVRFTPLGKTRKVLADNECE